MSTIVGIPLTWFILFIVQIVTGGTSAYGVSGFWRKLFSITLQAPWLLPFGENESWMFPAAALFLLVPFFFTTWLFEYIMMRNRLAAEIVEDEVNSVELKVAEAMVFSGVRTANLLTYGLIALLLVLGLVLTIINQSRSPY